jgi:hypothetical protein
MRSPLKRYKPVPKRRVKPRRGQPTKNDKDTLRLAVYERAQGLCELHLLPDCITGVLPFEGDTPWDHGHLVHLKSRGAGGQWTMQNCRWGCHVCHLVGIHQKGLKPNL